VAPDQEAVGGRPAVVGDLAEVVVVLVEVVALAVGKNY